MKRTVLSIFLLGLFCSNVNGMNVDGWSSFAPVKTQREEKFKCIEISNIKELDDELNAKLDEEYEKKIALDNEKCKLVNTFDKLWYSVKKPSDIEYLDAIRESLDAINKITDYCKELRKSALKMVICELFLENCEDNGRFLNDTISYIKKEYLQDTDDIDNLVKYYAGLGGVKRIKIYLCEERYSFFDLYSKVLISGVEKFTDLTDKKTIEDRYMVSVLDTFRAYVDKWSIDKHYSEEDDFDPVIKYYFAEYAWEKLFKEDQAVVNCLKTHIIGGIYIGGDDNNNSEDFYKIFGCTNRFLLLENKGEMWYVIRNVIKKAYYDYVYKLDDDDAKYTFQCSLLNKFMYDFSDKYNDVVVRRVDYEFHLNFQTEVMKSYREHNVYEILRKYFVI